MKLRYLFVLFLAVPAAAAPFQWASLTPSSIQGGLFTGAMKTNAGWSEETLLPLYYENAAPADPWYKPSAAPLVLGGGGGSGNANASVGSVLDVGPQFMAGLEQFVGLFSAKDQAAVTTFFNCKPAATTCAALSLGVVANLTLEQDGKFSTTFKEIGAHPVGYIVGPSVYFK